MAVHRRVVFLALSDRIEEARWLSTAEKDAVRQALAADAHAKALRSFGSSAFASPRVWLLCMVYFGVSIGSNTVGFWQPTIIKCVSALKRAPTRNYA